MKKLNKIILMVLICMSSLNALEFIVQDTNSSKKDATWIALPYVFSSTSMGLTTGVVAILNGYIQPQMNIVATAFIGENMPVEELNNIGSSTPQQEQAKGAALAITGYRPWFSKRMFISLFGSYAYYPNQRLYLNGSNESQKNLEPDSSSIELTPLQTQGFNNWAKIDMSYILPFGEGENSIVPIIKTVRGIPVNRDAIGGGIPFVTGQTVLGGELFYTKWTADKFTQEPALNSNGFRLYMEHDNTDYPDNPSRGYNMRFQASMDLGLSNSTQSWNALEASYSHYLEMPNYTWSRQNVIALNAWTAYSPSWDKSKKLNSDDPDAVIDLHQPPMWEGAKLGGFYRMRAYDMNRYNDKAALYFAAEYRVIPNFNPMHNQKWNPIPIDWFQAVMFAEAGRVAPSYDLITLSQDMKYDVGFSIRALAAKIPVRFEMAFGDEGSNMWVMVKQPF